MDHLRNSIKLYFCELSLDKVFKDNSDIKNIEEKGFLFRDHTVKINDFNYRTNDELDNLYSKLNDDWFKEPGKQHEKKKKSVFYLLTHFNEQVLTEVETQPYIKYEHLLKWRDLSYLLGEDIFTTSYIAYRDVQSQKKRGYFSWKSTIVTNNSRLSQLLKPGIAENHAHFNATGPTFELSWIVLMNRYKDSDIYNKISDLSREGKLSPKVQRSYGNQDLGLHELIKLAIILRFELLRNYIKTETETDIFINFSKKDYKKNLFTSNPNADNISLNFEEYWDNINVYKNHSSSQYYHNNQKDYIDYAIPLSLHSENNKGCFYFSGERKLLYKSFYYLYKSNEKETLNENYLTNTLHAYLLIKNIVRQEIIQLNQRLGFGNFKRYQDRKLFFLAAESIHMKLFAQHVLLNNRSGMNIVSHELRIGPDKNEEKLNRTIKKILTAEKKIVFSKKPSGEIPQSVEDYLTPKVDFKDNKPAISESKTFFTLHFFKTQEAKAKDQDQDKNVHFSRNYKLRQNVRKQAQGIIKFRNKYPEFARYVKGIDAASSEINARPEVFAQVFRMLKHHQLRDNETPLKEVVVSNKLNITFHAGEDFFDIVDGLRYIDECICFLGMENRDRLGHALALGINVQKYYELKKYKLLIPKQTLLDNLSWILSAVHKHGLKEHLSEVYRLENLFKKLYSELYLASIPRNEKSKNLLSHLSHHEYHDAWMLRGDCPELYSKFYNETKNISCIEFFEKQISNTYWERCRLNNSNPQLIGLRNREELVRLYYEYHYNHNVKVKGEEIKQFEITIPYLRLVQDVQVKMMQQIALKNIMIETNPTSNCLIGPIQKYIEHPIMRWYNLGLETDVDLIRSCPQICVSINTDDAGLFSTSLENEYALMAIALEKEKDEHGNPKYKSSMIYDWLDRIRQMGIQQSFMNR